MSKSRFAQALDRYNENQQTGSVIAKSRFAQALDRYNQAEKAQQQQMLDTINKEMTGALPAGVQGPVLSPVERASVAATKKRDTARNDYIYGKADTSKFTYQTPAEYDAEIAKLEKQYLSIPKQTFSNPDVTPSVSMFFSLADTPAGKEIKSKIDALTAERNFLNRENTIAAKYGNLVNNADFAVNSMAGTPAYEEFENSQDRDAYEQINGVKTTNDSVVQFMDDVRDLIMVSGKEGYEYMTDAERANYNYLFNTVGAEKAREYLNDIATILSYRRSRAKQFDETEEYNQSSDWGKFGKNVGTLVTSPVGAIMSGLDDLDQAVSGKEYNPYTAAHDLTAYTDTVRGATAQEIYQGVYESTGSGTTAQLVSTFYQSGMSAADAIVGSAALGKYYLLVAGANAATHKAKELYESGADGWQIAFGSVASGVIEAVAEKIPLDELWKMTGGTKGVRQIVYNVIRQMGLEGTEEGLTEIGNTIADCIIQGGNSDLSRQIAAYENEGYDPAQAKQMAFRDKVVDVAWSYAGGMLAGGPSAAVFSTVGSVRDYQQTKSVGNAILADGQQLQAAITAGLHTAPNTDAHKIAVAVQTKLASGDGNKISAYQVGEMVRDTMTPETRKATALYTSVRQSAQALGVDDTTAEEVGTIAAATGRQVEFVRPEDLQIVGPNGVSIPEGRYTSDGRVQLNAAMPAERLTGYLIKHELTHSIENTAQWDQLVQIVRSGMGEQAFINAVNEVTQRYAANNETLTDRGAQREVVAQWVGQNLFQNGFAQAIVSGNASVGNAFVRTLDKLRLALGGTKNSRTASNIALVERLFMRALQNAPSQNNEGQQYVIVALANGKIYVQADRNVLSGDDPKIWEQQIDTFFDNVLLANGSLDVESVEGDTLTITKDQTVWKGKDEHVQIRGKKRQLRKGEYYVKLHALSHMDELAEASVVQKNPDGSRKIEPDKKNHPFAKDGFEYRTVFFRDLDGKYYRITLSVGLADGIATVYNVGQIKETAAPEGEIISAIGSKAQGAAVSNTIKAQNSFGVNNYSMQSGGENSQFSFGDADEGDLTTPPPSDAANSQALGNLGESTGHQLPISVGMTEQERYEQLKDRTIFAVEGQTLNVEELSLAELEHKAKGRAEKIIYPLAEKIGILNRELSTPELDVTFELTKGNGLKASLSHQLKYGGTYADFAKALINLDAVLQNSVLLELHADKYAGTIRENENLLNTAVLIGLYQDGDFIVPVQFEVKRLKDNPNKLYLTVAMTKMKAGVLGVTSDVHGQSPRNLIPASTYSLAEIFKNINPKDSEFLKYVPDGFLNIEQKVEKYRALDAERKKINSYPKKNQQYSFSFSDEAETKAFEQANISGGNSFPKTIAQGRTIEELEQELPERTLFNRAYMSQQLDRPDSTVEIDGREVNSETYMDMLEDTLPDTEEGIEAFIQDTSQRYGDELARVYDETGEVPSRTSPIKLQLFAANRKLERIRLSKGEEGGTLLRRFFENRLKNLDANQTHAAEMVEYLAGRDERYSPISNAKTLKMAQDKLENDPDYAKRIERRIKHHKPGDVMNDVDAAAAQWMINKAKNNGDLELYADLVQGVSRYGTALGRAVQILSLQARLTPEGTIRAALRTMRKSIDAMHGDGASDEIDLVSGTIADAIERAAAATEQAESDAEVNLEGATVEQLEEGLLDSIKENPSPYITQAEIEGIIRRAVDSCTNISAHIKKLLHDPKNQKALAEKLLRIHQNGHLTDATTAKAVKEALGLPYLPAEDMAQLVGLVEEMQATEAGTLERADAAEKIYQFLGERLPSTKAEHFMNWRKFAMLFNPKTHFRNIGSNGAMMGVSWVDSAFATLFQRMVLSDKSKRTAYLGWRISDHGKQLVQNSEMFKKQTDRAIARLREDEKYDFTDAKLKRYGQRFGKNKVAATVNKGNNFNSKIMEIEDLLFFKPAFRDALGQVMTAREVTEVTDEIFDIAYNKAAEAVFRAQNGIASTVSYLKRGMFDVNTSKGKKVLGYFADIVLPFTTTPANIATSSFEHSPLGYLKSGYDLVQTLRKAPNAKGMAEVLNGFAKNTTGAVLWALGLLFGHLGWFNSGYGKTEKERAADELAGIQENAVVFGNVSFTLDWLQPAVSPFVVGASIGQRLREDGLTLANCMGSFMDGLDGLLELTVFQSLYDVLGGYNAGASASLASVAENAVSQSIPTLLGQTARAIDPAQRKTRGDNEFETIINQIMAKIPGLTYLLEPELDIWGDEVYRTGKASGFSAFINVVQQFLSPSNIKIATGDDHLSRAVLELYNSGADRASHAIPTAVTRDNAKELGVDYEDLVRAVASIQRERIEDLMSDQTVYTVLTEDESDKKKMRKKSWSEMTEDERLRVMDRVYTDVKSSVSDPEEEYYDEIIRRMRNGN